MWHDYEDHDFAWPTNYHLCLDRVEQSIFLRPYFNPFEWEPLEIYDPIGDSGQ